ncbi:MAG: hypothetical protein PVF68_13165 [Acidobacteriota bacterium]|jgi:hypothetical protein
MTNLYRHRQPGFVVTWTVGPMVLLAAGLAIYLGLQDPVQAVIPALVALLFLALLVAFGGLTVEVGPERVRLWFGPGWVHKQFPVARIEGARCVRNRWWYGWGIRLTPHGWLFNVAGLDAVEIRMGDGRTYRIGTDEPDTLRSAIESVLAVGGTPPQAGRTS